MWVSVPRKKEEELLNFFFKKTEWKYLPLIEFLRSTSEQRRKAVFQRDPLSGEVYGFLVEVENHILFPFLNLKKTEPSALPELHHFFDLNKTGILIGSPLQVKVVGALIRQRSLLQKSYFLRYSGKNFSRIPAPRDRLFLRKATLHRKKELLPLFEGYYGEEVLLPGQPYSPEAPRDRFLKRVSEGSVYYAEYKGKPVSKVDIVVKGEFFAQIGGVYTLKEMRNKKIGQWLLSRLMEHYLLEEGIYFSLFVQTENRPALKLYENLGFIGRIPLEMIYYRL